MGDIEKNGITMTFFFLFLSSVAFKVLYIYTKSSTSSSLSQFLNFHKRNFSNFFLYREKIKCLSNRYEETVIGDNANKVLENMFLAILKGRMLYFCMICPIFYSICYVVIYLFVYKIESVWFYFWLCTFDIYWQGETVNFIFICMNLTLKNLNLVH